jgi:glycosyltransferase involved in cell wall biosynthesis
LLSVGRLVAHKGHTILLDAVAKLPYIPQWHLTIAGEGPEHINLNSQLQHLSLEEHVTMTGEISDEALASIYSLSDIFILPSINTKLGIEGFGIVLLEAMAFGAVIVASRCGGIIETVGDNSDIAVLVPPGDPNALNVAILSLINDQQRRVDMAKLARRFCMERYAWK